jgi:hypothetical protein
MTNERKTITDIKAEERRQERTQKQREFLGRLRSVAKFLLVMAVFVVAFNHRGQIEKFSRTAIDRVMKHITLSSQARQKAVDYQKQLDDATTNGVP